MSCCFPPKNVQNELQNTEIQRKEADITFQMSIFCFFVLSSLKTDPLLLRQLNDDYKPHRDL